MDRLLGQPFISSLHMPMEEVGRVSWARPLWRRLLAGRTVEYTFHQVPQDMVLVMDLGGRKTLVAHPDIIRRMRATQGE